MVCKGKATLQLTLFLTAPEAKLHYDIMKSSHTRTCLINSNGNAKESAWWEVGKRTEIQWRREREKKKDNWCITSGQQEKRSFELLLLWLKWLEIDHLNTEQHFSISEWMHTNTHARAATCRTAGITPESSKLEGGKKSNLCPSPPPLPPPPPPHLLCNVWF